jgi:hypothetical protein
MTLPNPSSAATLQHMPTIILSHVLHYYAKIVEALANLTGNRPFARPSIKIK